MQQTLGNFAPILLELECFDGKAKFCGPQRAGDVEKVQGFAQASNVYIGLILQGPFTATARVAIHADLRQRCDSSETRFAAADRREHDSLGVVEGSRQLGVFSVPDLKQSLAAVSPDCNAGSSALGRYDDCVNALNVPTVAQEQLAQE